MIWLALAFLAGALSACFLPDRVTSSVRAAAGWAWERVAGKRAASTPKAGAAVSGAPGAFAGAVSPTAPNNPIGVPLGTAAKNLGGALVSVLGWAAKHPILALGLIILALYMFFGLPFGLGKSKDLLRLERELAQARAETLEALNARDARIHALELRGARERATISQATQRGRDAIAAAAPDHEDPLDPKLVAAFRDALDELCVPRADGNRPHSCGSGA